MTIQDLGALGEALGAFLLIISVIYLALQVKLARQSVLLDTVQRVKENHHQVYALAASNPQLSELILRDANAQSMTEAERFQLVNWYRLIISNWDNQIELHKKGPMQKIVIIRGTQRAFSAMSQRPVFSELWSRDSELIEPEIKAIIEGNG